MRGTSHSYRRDRTGEIKALRKNHIRPYKLVIRGTAEWDKQEQDRANMGCACLSFGPILPGLGFGEEPTEEQQKEVRRQFLGVWS